MQKWMKTLFFLLEQNCKTNPTRIHNYAQTCLAKSLPTMTCQEPSKWFSKCSFINTAISLASVHLRVASAMATRAVAVNSSVNQSLISHQHNWKVFKALEVAEHWSSSRIWTLWTLIHWGSHNLIMFAFNDVTSQQHNEIGVRKPSK